MARPRSAVPKYTLHKSSGQARVFIDGREIYLGKYNTPESRAEYARVLAELQAAKSPAAVARPSQSLTVDQVLLAFWKHAESHYRRPDGTTTNQITEYRCAFVPLRQLYGHTAADEFGPLALKAVRQKMVGAGLCRTLVNSRVGKLKRVWKWAASEQLIPATTYQALATVAGLQRGRTEARETEPVGPVPAEHVRRTLPYLRPDRMRREARGVLADMVREAGAFYAAGRRLCPPAEVMRAVSEYRDKEDIIGRFLDSQTARQPDGAGVRGGELYRAFTRWYRAEVEPDGTDCPRWRTFFARVAERYGEPRKLKGYMTYAAKLAPKAA